MNTSIILFILLAPFVGALLILLVGGLLVRADIHRTAAIRRDRNYPPSRILHDLRAVQDLVIDFIAKSDPSRRFLKYLARNKKPVRLVALVGHEVVRRLNALPPSKGAESGSSVMITAPDYQELTAAITAARKLATDPGKIGLLREKLVQATVLDGGASPRDLVTMNTRAELVDLETNESVELMPVYPVDANILDGRVSVFHPLGAAMLGHHVGDKFEWPVPYGVRRFEVKSIRFQPEAAFQLAA